MFDTESTVSVQQRDTAALAAEKGVRIQAGREVHYLRPSQVMRIGSGSDEASVVYLFEGKALVLYGIKPDDVATLLGWKG